MFAQGSCVVRFLQEVIALTRELISEEKNDGHQSKRFKSAAEADADKWKSGDKCMAVWRVDGRFDHWPLSERPRASVDLSLYLYAFRCYPATVDKILEDGMCTVIFDGYTTAEMTQV